MSYNPSVEITYQLTVDDFRHAIRVCRTRNAFLRLSLRFGFGFAILGLASGVVLLIVAPRSSTFRNLAPLYVVLILWTILMWLSPYFSARSQFRGSPGAKAPITLDATDAGLHFRSMYTDAKVEWSAYVKWMEGKTIFAVFPHPKIFNVIPKRAFSNDQLDEFRELLRKYVKSRR